MFSINKNENIGKVKPEEIEDKMPVLYEQFGDAPLKELQGKTPNTFYKDLPAIALLELLEEHQERSFSSTQREILPSEPIP